MSEARFLLEAPLDRVAYVHIAGGQKLAAIYHDTHAHPVGSGPLELLQRVLSHAGALPVLLEQGCAFGGREELEAELDQLGQLSS